MGDVRACEALALLFICISGPGCQCNPHVNTAGIRWVAALASGIELIGDGGAISEKTIVEHKMTVANRTTGEKRTWSLAREMQVARRTPT